MSTMNQVMLTGYLGRDLRLFEFKSGNKIAVAPLATYDFYDDENGVRHAITDWHNLVFKNEKADVALERLKKGSFVYIEGKTRTRQYQDKDDITQRITEIIVLNFRVMQNPLVGTDDPQSEYEANEFKFVE